LYQRLAVFPLCLPPLRQRPEDIFHLVRYFLRQLERPEVELVTGAIECLQRYDWPGNVRELVTVLRRILFLMESDSILTPETIKDGLGWTDRTEL
jgi:transcriptional regulator with PAS, ATPase and Fis domain